MSLEERAKIAEENATEYGTSTITLEELNYIRDSAYSEGCLAGVELGKKQTLDEITAMIDKTCGTLKELMNKSYSLIGDNGEANAMHLQAIAFFQQKWESYEFEFKSLISGYAKGAWS